MHDTTDTTRHDEAADAIRDALPTPDQEATDRIARRIADGVRDQEQVARSARRPGRRRVGMLRPALAAGAVMVAGAVALLAPGQDQDGRGIGPELAAAQVLHAAGESALEVDWHPLRAGEYHYTSTSWINPMGRTRLTEDQWRAADGTGRIEVREASQLPAGTVYWTPAFDCMAVATVSGLPPAQTFTAAGGSLPTCWSRHGTLAGAFGEIVDAPPAGALVDGVDTYGARIEDTLRWESTITEQPGPPPGAQEAIDNGDGTATAVKPGPVTEESPARMPREATWVQVRAAEHVVFSGDLTRPPSPMLGDLDWTRAFGADVSTLPTSGDEMLELIRAKARAANEKQRRQADAGVPTAVSPSVDHAAVTIATQVLANAPLSPRQRRALFDAMAVIAEESDATVSSSSDLPDGPGNATRIEFTYDLPNSPSGDSTTPFRTDIYLDEETYELRAISFGATDMEPYVTTWKRTQRLTSLERPADD